MLDYQNGKIYTIRYRKDSSLIYVGNIKTMPKLFYGLYFSCIKGFSDSVFIFGFALFPELGKYFLKLNFEKF